MSPFVGLLISLVLVYVMVKTYHTVPSNTRLVVFRLGRYSGILGPGTWITLPFVDKVVRVELDRELPHWQGLTAEQVTEAVEQRMGLRS